jgi:hypothetical protein
MTDKPRGDQEAPVERSEETAESSQIGAAAPPSLPDPNDEIPVPIAMSPAEVDERAQVVEALREEEGIPTPPEQADQPADQPADQQG